ncbi:MAG: HD domain-containing protein [Lachnospiraceae bacterium]|nr:HD domain-containing protein [Lachnospiraceae bacterium]
MQKSLEEIQEELKKVLKRKRYQHTVGVRYTAQAMAMCFDEDIEKAGYAGMLHDCAKYLSDEEMLVECRKHHIVCSDTEKIRPSLLHAKLGACYAREFYGVEDDQILSGIRWHTTGKPGMSNFEKIIFIADYIEPGRKMIPGMEEIRRAAFCNLDEAMFLILENTLSYLEDTSKSRKDMIDSYTEDAYDFYKELRRRRKGA